VLHLRSSGGLFGADRIVLDLCRELGGHGYRAVLAPLVEADGSGEELAARARDLGIKVAPLCMRWSYDPGAVWRLRRLVSSTGAVLVHAHDYKSDVLAALAGGWWRRISTLHGWVGTSPLLRLKEHLDAHLVRRFDRVICVSAAMARREQARGLRDPVVIPNGIDLSPYVGARDADRADLKRELGLDAEVPVIGDIGRLSEEKGYDVLLYAATRLISEGRDLQVLLIGEGPMEEMLGRLAGDLGISARLVMPGLRLDAPRLYPALDVFCMPSRREGLPLALLEALASGCAAVTTPVGGIPEVIGEGEGQVALVVPPDNPEALALGIERLLAAPELRTTLGEAGRRRVAESFSTQRMTAEVAELYDGMLAEVENGKGAGE
jgi:glycosyltransferase involved in cell wall biosynthesis